MKRILLAAFAAFGVSETAHAARQPDLVCVSDGDLSVLAYQDVLGDYTTVALADGAQIIATFDEFRDETPQGPSDTVFRYVFTNGDYAVTLQEGGFTEMATAKVQQGDETLADMTCRER